MKYRPGLRRMTPQLSRDSSNYYAAMSGKAPVDLPSVLPARKPREPRQKRERSLTPSEHQSQAAVISWWALQHKAYGLPVFALFAIPNGGARDMITGARLKAEGVRPGIPDLMLAATDRPGHPGGHHGLFIEMKKPLNYPSTAQHDVITYLHEAGYMCKVAYSTDAAIAVIQGYIGGDEL